MLKRIHHLLHVEGYTIKGVQKLLRDVGKKQVLMGAGTSQAILRQGQGTDNNMNMPDGAAGDSGLVESMETGVAESQAGEFVPTSSKAMRPSGSESGLQGGNQRYVNEPDVVSGKLTDRQRAILEDMLLDLKELREILKR